MAPLSKVALLEDDCFDEYDDVTSGPHSILFGIKGSISPGSDLQRIQGNTTYTQQAQSVQILKSNSEESNRRQREEQISSPKVLIRSDTYETLENCSPRREAGKTIIRSATSSPRRERELIQPSNVKNLISSTTFSTQEDVSNCSTQTCSVTTEISSSSSELQQTVIFTEHRIINKGDTYSLRRNTFTLPEDEKKKVLSFSLRSNNTFTDCEVSNTIIKNTIDDSFDKKIPSTPPKYSNQIPLFHSTPKRNSDQSDVENSPRRRVRPPPAPFNSTFEDEATKRDSLEFEESLGILTPEQMTDVTGFSGFRTPSSENIGSLSNDFQNVPPKIQYDIKTNELGSPNLVDASIKDTSLGIIDENMLSTFTMKSDTTMNMDLPLDPTDSQNKNYACTRLEQTPSPEDLPLDPTPVIEIDPKTEPTKSKTNSSFITSITSITSLDTGYQGDGEMSRPASRGPDHSPLTRRPLQRPQPRRPDPMTDSDFYTESDADNHEEHPLRGDRLARVIDGTLYGVDPQAAADIYVNNRENMDSSGIFTDIEGNTRADELSSADNNEHPDASPSPSDTSSKTISNNSQDNAPTPANRTMIKSEANSTICENPAENMDVDIPTKRKSPAPSSAASSPASVRSPRHTPRDEATAKKYKVPKRNVASKVKAVLETSNQPTAKEIIRAPPKKAAGRWDAIMNKISKTSNEKPNLKEIKSKVFTSHSTTTVRQNGSPRTSNTKLRRNRTRAETVPSKNNIESLHSSASDLSGASPAKRIGSAKKKAEVVRVTQVLTANKLSPRSPHKNTTVLENNKKNSAGVPVSNDIKFQSRRPILQTKEKKQNSTVPAKDCGRATGKGGRASPGARPQQQNRASLAPPPRTAEALAVLIQHLVFNLEAFQTPSLKKQVEKNRIVAEEARFSCRQLEETLAQARIEHTRVLEEERDRCRKDIAELVEQHKINLALVNHQHSEAEQRLLAEYENLKKELSLTHNDQLLKLRAECNKLQKTHEQTLEILREENDSIREEIDDKNALIEKLESYKREKEKLEKDFKMKELKFKEDLQLINDELAQLKEENVRIMNFASEGKENKLQIVLAEVESLRAVLELKQTEVSELRRALAEANQKADLLPSAIEKVSVLTARCEDLQSQLEQKSLCEHQLNLDNKKLQESLNEVCNHSKRISQHNEELQWKLKQNKEVVTRVLEQAEETAFNRSLLSSSFNERHNNSAKNLERTMSFRERSLSNKSYSSADESNRSRKSKNSYDLDSEDFSPPSSPKVKGVVEKSDSVSYVLEMEESPEMIASRIVRRSFRNSTPPKTTPTKSPANKRPRMKNNPLSLSASASAIIPMMSRNDHLRSRSVSVRNGDVELSNNADEVFMWHAITSSSTPYNHRYSKDKLCDGSVYFSATSETKFENDIDLDDNYNGDDIKLPTLPSEIGRKDDSQSLPVPKHLAGEAMVSESNSEDESTASSSSGQL